MSIVLHHVILAEMHHVVGGFSDKIQEVFEYTGTYGIKKVPIPISELPSVTSEIKHRFQSAVHEGFELAQNIILEEVIKCLKFKKLVDAQLKIVGSNEEKNYYKKIKTTIDRIILIYRHFSDFVVWQVFKGNHQKIRQAFLGDAGRPSLLTSNIESLQRLIPINKTKFPGSFSLMTDLTSFFDIGDLIVIYKNEVRFTEVKEGKVNHKIFKFIDFLGDPKNKIEEYDYSGLNQKFFEQTKRVLNQKQRDFQFLKSVGTPENKHHLVDNGSEFNYFTNADRYYDEFIKCFWNSFDDGFDLLIVEEIIYIGMFTGPKQQHSEELMKSLQTEYLGEEGRIYDYDEIFSTPIVEPLLFKPYGKEVFFNIFFDHITIKMFINVSKLVSLFNDLGFECKWTSRKVSQEIYNKYKNSKDSIFRWNNKSLQVEKDGSTVYLTEYFVHRLLFDAVKPSQFIIGNGKEIYE